MSLRILEWPKFTSGVFSEALSPRFPGLSATIGVFDGVHIGHQALLRRIVAQTPLIPTVITFKQNPKELLQPSQWEGDILSLNRKLEILEETGIRLVILIDFSKNFSTLSGKDFFSLLCSYGKPRYIAVGSDFRCGYQGDTGAGDISRLCGGIVVDTIEPIPAQPVASFDVQALNPISSSLIRRAILSGDLDKAAAMLGRSVEFDATGAMRSSRGAAVFYPTQGIKQIMPAPGRYSALLYRRNAAQGKEAEVTIEDDGILIPYGEYDEHLARIAFLSAR